MHKTILIVTIVLFTGSSGLLAQKKLVWPVLQMTTYTSNNETGALKPKFPAVLTSQFENQEVTISGYLIPIDVVEKRYALSKNPFSACFFCGNAGPETVIELQFKDAPGRFATDKYVVIKGILRLNRQGSELFFTLKNAVFYG